MRARSFHCERNSRANAIRELRSCPLQQFHRRHSLARETLRSSVLMEPPSSPTTSLQFRNGEARQARNQHEYYDPVQTHSSPQLTK